MSSCGRTSGKQSSDADVTRDKRKVFSLAMNSWHIFSVLNRFLRPDRACGEDFCSQTHSRVSHSLRAISVGCAQALSELSEVYTGFLLTLDEFVVNHTTIVVSNQPVRCEITDLWSSEFDQCQRFALALHGIFLYDSLRAG